MDRFDPFSADYLADPYPHLARARADAPVFPLADEARTTLREGGFRAGATMSNCDPPKHTRIRRHNLRPFSARRTAALEPRVRAAAEELVVVRQPDGVLLGPPVGGRADRRSPPTWRGTGGTASVSSPTGSWRRATTSPATLSGSA